MPTISTIAAARVALYDLLVANAPPSTAYPTEPVQVVFGFPAHEELEVVAILGVRTSDEEPGQIGAKRRQESYTLDVGVKVHDPQAETPAERKAADTRAFALADWVRQTIHANWTLSRTVRTAEVVEQRSDGLQLGDKVGAVVFVLLGVECSATITDPVAGP